MNLSPTQVAALRLLAAQDGRGEVGYAPLGRRTVTALRRMGLTELDRVDEHSERFGYNFGRYSEWRTVTHTIERLTDAGWAVVNGATV